MKYRRLIHFFPKPLLLVLLVIPLCAMMCTDIVHDVGYEATISRAVGVDSVEVTFSDGTSILEQAKIGPEADSVTLKSSKERSGRFLFTVGVFCTGASEWAYVIPQPFDVEDTTRVFIRNATPIDCEHVANRNVVYQIAPVSIFEDRVYP